VRSSVLGAAAFFLSFHLLAAASAHAQGRHSEMRSKPPPSSGIAHNFFTWLHHVTGAGPHRHRIVSAPPLPRPRPAQLAKVPVEQPAAAALEPKKAQPAATAVQPNNAPGAAERDRAPAPAVEANEAQPAAAAAEPNNALGAAERDKAQPAATAVVPNDAPTVAEPDRAQPATAAVERSDAATAAQRDRAPAPATESNEAQPAAALIPSAPAPAVEPDKAAAEVPPGAFEQTKATPGTPTGTAVEGANIPD
jgi:hypothetical protein